uniref:Guanine nucleotide binding protein (G protein), alpha 15 (Gq class) n=1 Tax=Echinostoma caproni TaxID=27848 RepID=A0A183AWG7_9TREM
LCSLLSAMSDSLRLFACCTGPNSSHTSAELLRWQRKRNREIERDLKKEKDKLRRRQMILLLGTGESGKSTFLKQMKIINGKRFSVKEMEQLKDIIYDNIYKGVLFLLQNHKELSALPAVVLEGSHLKMNGWCKGDEELNLIGILSQRFSRLGS